MFSHLSEAIAEIIYDNDMERLGHMGWTIWDDLNTQLQEYYLKVADEILNVFDEENLYELEKRNL